MSAHRSPLSLEERRQRKNARNRAWYAENRERKLAQNRAWAAVNRPAGGGTHRAKYLANRERALALSKVWSAANRDRKRLAWQRWSDANPEAVRAHNLTQTTKRRVRYLNAFVETVDPQAVFVRDGGVCQICDTFIGDAKWHIDHRVPLARGGEHSYANCQLAHATCNRIKNAKVPV